MKPCAHNRQAITWSVLNLLEEPQARELDLHLKACPGCLAYRQEMVHVTQSFSAIELPSRFALPPAFHRTLVSRLEHSKPVSFWLTAALALRRHAFLAGAFSLMLFMAVLFAWRQHSRPTRIRTDQASISKPSITLSPPIPAPTLSNYQRVANRSLENLEILLDRQNLAHSTAATAPLYTASTLTDVKSVE